MATGSRTLKLSILADVDQLKKSLAQANNDVESSSSKIGDFSKKVGLAFAAAGAAAAAYAGKLLIDGVKSAIEDEKAQAILGKTLENVTKATKDQIAQVEKYILKTSLASGVTDNKLRPAFDRLVRSTKDVNEAQKLTNLALDISVGTGKDLETIANALGKAYNGNVTALAKLGIQTKETIIDNSNVTKSHEAVEKATSALWSTELRYGVESEKANKAREKLAEVTEKLGNTTGKTKEISADFNTIMERLTDTFAGQATTAAETFQGKMDRLKVAFDEGKETVGSFILDAITPLVSGFVNKVVPAIQEVAAEIGPKLTPIFRALGDYFNNVLVPAFNAFYNFIKDYIVPILNVTLVPIIKALFDAFNLISQALTENKDKLQPLADAFRVFATFIRDYIAPIIGTFISSSISGIAGVISALIGVVADVTSAVNSGFTRVRNFFTDIINYVQNTASNLISPIVTAFRAAINTIIGLWNRLDFEITFTVPSWVPIIGGNTWSSGDIFPDFPYLAQGGIVTSPTLAMIGEAGPEAVIPLNKSAMMGNTFNITVNGAIDAEGTARTIVNTLNNSFYRGTGGATALVTS